MAEPSGDSDIKRCSSWWRSFGPALITACVVFGPGSLLISSNIGAKHGYELLWLLILTGILMGTYLTMGARIGDMRAEEPEGGEVNAALAEVMENYLSRLGGLDVAVFGHLHPSHLKDKVTFEVEAAPVVLYKNAKGEWKWRFIFDKDVMTEINEEEVTKAVILQPTVDSENRVVADVEAEGRVRLSLAKVSPVETLKGEEMQAAALDALAYTRDRAPDAMKAAELEGESGESYARALVNIYSKKGRIPLTSGRWFGEMYLTHLDDGSITPVDVAKVRIARELGIDVTDEMLEDTARLDEALAAALNVFLGILSLRI